ncbi:MAG: ABC transporter permease [Desulfurococcaceae archaeon]
MAPRTLIKSILFNLKMYRLYWTSLVTVTVLLPLTYMAVVVLSSGGSAESFLVGLTGYVVMACFSTLVYPVAVTVANTFEEQVLELHASLPISLRELFASYIVSQLLFSIPPVALGVALLLVAAGGLNWIYVFLSLLISALLFPNIAVLLGLTVRNRYRLEPLLTLLIILLAIATPLYYTLKGIYQPWRTVMLFNPFTHIVCLLRLSVGFQEGVPVSYSLAYLISLTLLLTAVTLYKTRQGALMVLEKR